MCAAIRHPRIFFSVQVADSGSLTPGRVLVDSAWYHSELGDFSAGCWLVDESVEGAAVQTTTYVSSSRKCKPIQPSALDFSYMPLSCFSFLPQYFSVQNSVLIQRQHSRPRYHPPTTTLNLAHIPYARKPPTHAHTVPWSGPFSLVQRFASCQGTDLPTP